MLIIKKNATVFTKMRYKKRVNCLFPSLSIMFLNTGVLIMDPERQSMKRLHDRGISGLFFMFLLIMVLMGSPYEQAFCSEPEKSSCPEDQIRFEQVSLEQGLSQSTVTCMAQDEKSFIWFGTGGGLNRYDGYDFKVFRNIPDDSTSLTRNWITDLYVDP